MASMSTSRPSLSKDMVHSKPSLSNRLQEALSLLPARRSPTKASTSSAAATTSSTTSKRSNPFSSIFSSRHKPSASAPSAVLLGSSLGSISKSSGAPPFSGLEVPPPVPPKSAPASRTVTPIVAPKPASQSVRARPTIPFANSRVTQPTAASSARTNPTVQTSVLPPRSAPLTHARNVSKIRIEPATPISPASTTSTSESKTPTATTSKSRITPSPTPLDTTSRTSIDRTESPSASRPRLPNRLPTSPPSAFAMKTPPPRSLPRKRSKTFPDPNDPVPPVPPTASQSQSVSRSMKTANRIVDAFESSPRVEDAPKSSVRSAVSPLSPGVASIRSKSTSPTPMSPVRPIRPPGDPALAGIVPNRARAVTTGSSRTIIPSAASIEAARVRSPTRPTLMSSSSTTITPRAHVRSPSDTSLPPPPRKAVPSINSSGSAAQYRRLARPVLRPLQTAPVAGVKSNISIVRSPSPETPITRSSSASPKTPAQNTEPSLGYLTSDDESKSKKRNIRNMFRRHRPDSLVSSSTLTSAVSGSGTSNASNAFVLRGQRTPKAPSTFGGLPEEEDHPPMQTRRGIKRHPHPVAEVPYPISFEEVVLQGEKHTQDLLSTVLQQKAYHFTPMDNFSKVKDVLDIGCGRGYWLMEAARECKHANLVGFDIVNVMHSPQEMRDRFGLSQSQIARIEFIQGNFFQTLPFLPARFDYIRLAFLELAIPESKWVPLLKDCWRVLKPGGHIEVVIESQLFPTVWSYDKQPVQEELEDEFRSMLETRDIPPATNIGEKMFFDAFARVQTHKHVSVCIAPRPAGRSSLDGPTSPGKFSSLRSVHSPWSSEPLVPSGMTSPSPIPFGRPSLDRSGSSMDVLPPTGQLVTSRTCTVPGIVVSPDVFIPISEDVLFTYASHGAMLLNASRLASFSDKYPNAMLDEYENEWQRHVERYWQYERSNRLRLGFRMKQFDDDDDDVPITGPTYGRWKWAKCEEDLEKPLEIRRFRAWSLSKPQPSR